MRLLLVTLLILHYLPLKNAKSFYEFRLPEIQIEMNHTVKIWNEIGLLDPNRTDIRFLFHSSQFGFKNPNFIRNVSDFLLMDNSFSTFNLIADATDDILESSENSSDFFEKPILWIIDFQSRDYAKIFPQFEIRQLSCDEFGSYENFGENRFSFQNFDLLLLETNSECGLKIHEEISKNSDFLLQNLALKWKFYDIILLETAETTNYTYSPYPEYRKELWKVENIKKQRYFQEIFALQEMFRAWSDRWHSVEIQLVLSLSARWAGHGIFDMRFFNVFYTLRKLFYFVISKSPLPEWPRWSHFVYMANHIFRLLPVQNNRNTVARQLMILEFIYIVAKYTVDDTRSVIWPYILVNEIIDLFSVYKFHTTEWLPFELQLVKILETSYHFILLNQYPDFYILIWLLVIFSLQLSSFFLYFRYPPMFWTVPIFDIPPVFGTKNRYMIYTRHVAIAFVSLTFWALSGGIEHGTVIMLFFLTLTVYHFLKYKNLLH